MTLSLATMTAELDALNTTAPAPTSAAPKSPCGCGCGGSKSTHSAGWPDPDEMIEELIELDSAAGPMGPEFGDEDAELSIEALVDLAQRHPGLRVTISYDG